MPSHPASPGTHTSAMDAPHFIGAVEDNWRLFSDNATDYTIGSTIGFGASSIVYSATYKTPDGQQVPCALKVLDLDLLPPHSLALLQRETTLMSLSKHPNVLRVRGSWIDGHKLYIALRLMNKGSAADVMHYGWPGGLDENVIICILRQALKGLDYLHVNGFIHRDVKAANLLIDDDGTVLLGDLGVAADLSEDLSQPEQSRTMTNATLTRVTSAATFRNTQTSSVSTSNSNAQSASNALTAKHIRLVDPVQRKRPAIGKRKSFVGTPCWMAPELIEGKKYASPVDIWSFGITALELAQGRPPRSRLPSHQVLLQTIQEPSPTLDRENGVHKYSRAFQEMIERCLVKDPAERPTTEQLLQMPVFRSSKKKSYLVGAILKDLPPLSQRQERRVLASRSNRNSGDSWDFATTIHSIHRRFIDRTNVDEEEPEHHPTTPKLIRNQSQTRPISIASGRRIPDSISPPSDHEEIIPDSISSSLSDVASSPLTSTSFSSGKSSAPTSASETASSKLFSRRFSSSTSPPTAVSLSSSPASASGKSSVWKKFKDVTQLSKKSSGNTY